MDEIDCPYIENLTQCHNIEVAPGNGDAWCSGKIEEALNPPKHVCDACGKLMINSLFTKNPNEDTLIRQNYSCILCGLKSFVTYNTSEDEFDVVSKIDEDHKKREPTCPCPINDLYIAGEPTKV
jgi:hypothetical protein